VAYYFVDMGFDSGNFGNFDIEHPVMIVIILFSAAKISMISCLSPSSLLVVLQTTS